MYPERIILSPSHVENFSEPQFVILCKLIKRTIQVDTVEFRLKKLTQLVKATEHSYMDN